MGGKTSYGTTTGESTSAPWSPQQPFIQQGFNQALGQLTGGSTVAPFSPQTQAGLNMTTQTAANSQIPQSASSFLNSLLGGGSTPMSTGSSVTPTAPAVRPTIPRMAGMAIDDRRAAMADYRTQMDAYRTAARASRASARTGAGGGGAAGAAGTGGSANAYIDELANSIGRKVVPGVMSTFAQSGRSGTSPLAQTAVGSGIAAELAPYMFGSAENVQNRLFQGDQNQLNRQMQGLGLAPTIDALQYSPANAMLGVGGAYDTKAQQQLDNPAQLLANYMNVVGQPFGSQTSSSGVQPIDHQSALAPLRIFGK
jgi:hypothetical protein